MSTPLSAPTTSSEREWDLLRAGSGADPQPGELGRIRSLLGQKVDWETVIRLSDEHGTSSLLCQNLARVDDLVPSSVMAGLRERYQENVYKSLLLARELIRVLDRLDALGIEVIVYKGLVLSEVYYGDLALRQSGDIDLFVHKQDVPRIQQAVNELGYTTRVPIPENAEEDYFEWGYECTFDTPAGKNLLELQWALQPRFYAVDFDMEGLFERAVNVSVAGRRLKTPSAEDLLLVLSVHAAKHVWGRLIWLRDIAQVLKQEKLNWSWVQSRAREFGIERILHVTLLLMKRFLATGIPEAIEKMIVADRAAPDFADEITPAVMRGVSYNEQQVAYFRLMMRLRERRVDRLRFMMRLTFTPGPGEWDAIRLPKVLFPLYRVVRLARLVARFAREAF